MNARYMFSLIAVIVLLLIAWAGVDGRVPVPEAATVEGFPTEMEVDYVRCWKMTE